MKGEMLKEDGDGTLEDSNQDLVTGALELPPFDAPKYREHLEDCDITEEQMIELLRTLDSIMRTFVDLGFGVDAVQLALPELAQLCESSEADAEFSGQEESASAKTDGNTGIFNSAAEVGPPQKE